MDLACSLLVLMFLNLQFRNRLMLVHAFQSQQYYRARFRRRAEYERARRRRYRRHRALVMELVFHHTFAAIFRGCYTERKIWRRERLQGPIFWESVQNFDSREWRQHFRMSKNTFEYLASELRPLLEKQTTNYRLPIDHRRRLAAVIWWLATPSEYRTVSTLFGIGISTLCVLTREVCFAINNRLFHRYISLPSGDRLDEVIEGFQLRGFPQCAGAVDGTHLPVLAPKENPADYHNRKGWHSIVLQAVVDHKYCFTDVYVGWPGRAHDARILAHSDLFVKAEHQQDGFLFPRNKSRIINGIEVPVFIIGDPAYPLKKWLMKGFSHNQHMTEEEGRFNHRLSSSRMVIENAFGRLKGRWRRLLKRNDVDTSFASEVVATCCILHNVCEIHGEQYDREWDQQRNAEEAAGGLHQPGAIQQGEGNVSAAQIRQAVMAIL